MSCKLLSYFPKQNYITYKVKDWEWLSNSCKYIYICIYMYIYIYIYIYIYRAGDVVYEVWIYAFLQ